MKVKLFFLAGLFVYASLSAQEPVVSFETNKDVGTTLNLRLRLETAGNVDVDWGNGIKTTYEVKAHPGNTDISGTLQGNVVKFYNDDLRYFECKNAGITNLDVLRAALLDVLYLDNNLLTSLDVSGNPNLRLFAISDNPITSIDFTNKEALTNVFLTNANFDACTLNSVFEALPTKTGNLKLNITGNPGALTSKTSIATEKGWTVNITGDGTGCPTTSNEEITNEDTTSIVWNGNILSFDNSKTGDIWLIDATGKTVLKANKVHSLDVSAFSDGLYLVKYNVQGVTETTKIVKQ